MRILLVGNLSDRKCGFQNFSYQTVHALQRAGHEVTAHDGTYSVVYARQQTGVPLVESFLPKDAASYDVIHVIWHPATMNHYSGCDFPAGPVLSVWNGCPAAWCPFTDRMHIRWGVLGREVNHEQLFYPIPDWVEDLPEPSSEFTVGYSGVRGDGLGTLKAVCDVRGWGTNFSQPGTWLTQEEEVRRLARSTVNVCWYGGEHDDRSGSAMVCLASKRPLLTNQVRMFIHLEPYPEDTYRSDDLEASLTTIHDDWQAGRPLKQPKQILQDLSWSSAAARLASVWESRR